MKQIKALFIILFLLLIVVIAVQNVPNLKTPVMFSIDLWFYNYQSPHIPLAFVAIITFLIGVVSMGLYGIIERFRLKKQVRLLEAELRQMEAERRQREKEVESSTDMVTTADYIDDDQFPE